MEDVQTLFGMQCKAVQESQSSFMRDNVQQLVALRPPVHQATATPAGSVVPMSISASCCAPQQPSAPAQSAVPMSVSLATGCNNAPEQSNSCAGSPAEMASNHAAASRAAPKQQQAPRRPSPPPPPPSAPSPPPPASESSSGAPSRSRLPGMEVYAVMTRTTATMTAQRAGPPPWSSGYWWGRWRV